MNCKICNHQSYLFDTVDLSKNCNDRDVKLTKLGTPVDYYRCGTCEFIFTNYFDSFSASEFCEIIYNQDYIKFDPHYSEIRPRANAKFMRSVLTECIPGNTGLDVLDYGAGNGKLSELLADRFSVTNYDALNPLFNRMPSNNFDVIFSSEVVEHLPFPQLFLDHWCKLLKRDGMVFFSTMLPPADIDMIKASWWYISPRNGHVSIYSQKSLTTLFAGASLSYEQLSNEWHMVFYADKRRDLDMQKLNSIFGQLPTGFIPITPT